MSRKKKVPFSKAIRNVELLHEYFPELLRMEEARTKQNKDTGEEANREE